MGADSVEYHEHTVAGRGDDPVARPPRLLRLARRDADVLGRLGACAARPRRRGRPGRLPGALRRRRRTSPSTGERLVALPASRSRARRLAAQVRRRAGRDRPRRGHARDRRRRARRHLDYLDRLVAERGGRRGRGQTAGGDRRADLGDLPARDDPGRRPAGARPRPDRERCVDARRAGRLEGRRHGLLARPPARGDGRRALGAAPQGGRARLRDRRRPGAVGTARGLGDRRHPRRGLRDPLEALGADHRGGRADASYAARSVAARATRDRKAEVPVEDLSPAGRPTSPPPATRRRTCSPRSTPPAPPTSAQRSTSTSSPASCSLRAGASPARRPSPRRRDRRRRPAPARPASLSARRRRETRPRPRRRDPAAARDRKQRAGVGGTLRARRRVPHRRAGETPRRRRGPEGRGTRPSPRLYIGSRSASARRSPQPSVRWRSASSPPGTASMSWSAWPVPARPRRSRRCGPASRPPATR